MSFHSSNPAHLARCVSDVKNKIFRYRRFSLKFFLGFLALLLICGAVLWFMLPRFIEDFVAQEAGSVGLEKPSIAIDQIRARVDGVAIRGIRLSDNKTDLAIPRLLVSYEWDEVLDGAVEDIEFFDLRLELDAMAWLDQFSGPSSNAETIEKQVRSFLDQPVLRSITLHDVVLMADYNNTIGTLSSDARVSAKGNVLSFDLNGSLEEAPISVAVELVADANLTTFSSRVKAFDLVALKQVISDWPLPYDLAPLNLSDGLASIEGSAELVGDALSSPSVDLNASQISFSIYGQSFHVPDLFLSASLAGDHTFALEANGTAEANGTVIASGWSIEAMIDAHVCELETLRIDRFRTFRPLPEITIGDLRFPRWNIPFDEPGRLPVGETKTFQFNDFSFSEGSFNFNLYQGNMTVDFLPNREAFRVQVTPTDAVLPLQGVVFQNFSYSGVIEPLKSPYLSFPQVLSGESIILGEESLVTNLALSFRLLDMSRLIVDSLSFTFAGSAYELNPAEVTIEHFDNGSVSIDLNASTFNVPDLPLTVEGLSGEVTFSSIDPLVTSGFQELRFDAVRYGEKDEALLSNFDLSIQVAGLNKLIIESLSFTFAGSVYELNPAEVTIEHFDNGSVSIDLNASTFNVPDLPLTVEGIKSAITLSSLDPMISAGPQELRLDVIRYGELELLDVRLLFSLEVNGTFALHEGNASLFGGEVVFEPTRFRLEDKEKKLAIRLRDVVGSQVVALIKKFDGEVEGKFSGLIPLSNLDGAWDYVGGYLELNPGTPGRLRYRSDGILTSDVQPGTAEFKRLRQVELALKDLDVKRLRLDFHLEGDERRITGDVRGRSKIDKKTTINLNYSPKVLAGFEELLQLDSKALGLD